MALASSLLGGKVLGEVSRSGSGVAAGDSFKSREFLIILYIESILSLCFY